MCKVINLTKARRDREIESFDKFRSEFKAERGIEAEGFKEQMARIKRSLEAINQLMAEVKRGEDN